MIALAPLPTLVEKQRAMNSSQENENKLIRMCGSSLAHAIAGNSHPAIFLGCGVLA